MKSIKLFLVGCAVALCAPTRFTTANAATEPPPADPAAELAALRAELAQATAALKEQGAQILALSAKPEQSDAAPDSELSRLAKGAGLEGLDDVSWRVKAGLSPKQAVDAAVAQIASNKQAEEAKAKKAEEAKNPKRR